MTASSFLHDVVDAALTPAEGGASMASAGSMRTSTARNHALVARVTARWQGTDTVSALALHVANAERFLCGAAARRRRGEAQ